MAAFSSTSPKGPGAAVLQTKIHWLLSISLLVAVTTAVFSAEKAARIEQARKFYSWEQEDPEDFLFAIRKAKLYIYESKEGWYHIDNCTNGSGETSGSKYSLVKIENDVLIFDGKDLKIPRSRIAYITRFEVPGK